MNNKVRRQDLEKLLFLDIETVRMSKELCINSKEYDLYAWKLRDKETSLLPPPDEVIKHYKLNAALYPEFNKIVCITIGFIKDSVLHLKSLTGGQKDIIEQFYNILNSTGFTPCGHNIIQFDMPTIRLKAFESGVNLELLSDKYSDSQQKPWVLADNFMDTMDITKGTYYHNLSLDSMCFLAGIDSPKDSISGADVSKTYYDVENGLQIISEYCKKDVKAVAELFCALQGKKSFLTDIVDKTDDVPRTEYSILEQLYHANELTQKIKEGLKQQIFGGGKKPTKVDKENFKKIILANYQQKNDKVAVKKQKEQEINEFIDKL
jgi:predicted PolB exonuclease-like 3'-5' exonuclease